MNAPQENQTGTSRRTFAILTLIESSVFIVPRHVLGGLRFAAPSDQLVLVAIRASGKAASA